MNYKVLMYGRTIINHNMLEKGLYESGTPILYPAAETLEDFKQRAEDYYSTIIKNGKRSLGFSKGVSSNKESYLENLSKCRLVEFELKQK